MIYVYNRNKIRFCVFFLFFILVSPFFFAESARAWLEHGTTYTDNTNGIDGLDRTYDVTMSPDGNHFYAVSFDDHAISHFSRNDTTGELSFVTCYKNEVDGVQGIWGPKNIVVSPDGRHIYVVDDRFARLTVFSRDQETGALGFVEFHRDNQNGVDGLGGIQRVAVSPDGNHVYTAANEDNAVAVFSRNGVTGALTYVTCYKNREGGVDGLASTASVIVSPDNRDVYSVGKDDHAVALFRRDASTGELDYVTCYRQKQNGLILLNGVNDVAVSPDGRTVYAVGSLANTLVVFSRNEETGELSFVEFHNDGEKGVDGLYYPSSIGVTPHGRGVYVTGYWNNSISSFIRNPATGTLSYIDTKISGMIGPMYFDVSPDGKHLYVSSVETDSVVFFRAESFP